MAKYLILIIGKIKNIKFDKIDFNLANYETSSTTYPKIQETSSYTLLKCIYYFQKKKIK